MASETTPHKTKVTVDGEVRPLAASLTAFRQRHQDWLGPLESEGPVYRLPHKTIQGLRKPPAGQRPIMSHEQAKAEVAFTDLCLGNKAVGVWNNRFVCPSYLVRPDALSETMLLGFNWTKKQIQTTLQFVGKTDSIALRLKGYVGWLVTEPAFLAKRDELASRWQALSAAERPYPIARSVQLSATLKEKQSAKGAIAAFQQDLNGFLDRWGLMEMLTWDLPQPQGPLLPAPVALDSPAMPKHGLHIVLPLHYPLTGTDDLLRQIHQQQVCLARDLGMDTSMAGLPHYEAYGQMLEVHLLELAIRSRYGKPGQRRGLVTVMEASMAETLKRSVDQVQKLRKAISACRAGKRSSVRWLRTRD